MSAGEIEAAAFNVVRAYNILEQLCLRVAKAFENHIDDDRGWHSQLVKRVSIAIPGIRPALFPEAAADQLRTLRGFRHVVVHAYEVSLRPERVVELTNIAEEIAGKLPGYVERFFGGL